MTYCLDISSRDYREKFVAFELVGFPLYQTKFCDDLLLWVKSIDMDINARIHTGGRAGRQELYRNIREMRTNSDILWDKIILEFKSLDDLILFKLSCL